MSIHETTRPVTIVVPVYGDLPSLTRCVETLTTNVDFSRHNVLLVNDCGPDADEIEASLLTQIDGLDGFRYERNEKNLGFVGACNRAATELDTTGNDILLLNSDTATTPGFVDELSAVLHSSPLHGIVCARSNNATVASFPFKLRNPSAGHGIERATEVHAALAPVIRRYTVSPVAMGFCFLVRRELITENGLFDEVFAPGYGEENDFCLRMNELGHSSVIANRVIVFHVGAQSFVGARRQALRSAHEKILVTRYPFYTTAIQAYLRFDRDPVDAFADALVPGDEVTRVLIDIDSIDKGGLDSWSESMLVALDSLASPDSLVVSASVPDARRDEIAAKFPRIQVIHQSRLDGLWDVAIAAAEDVTMAQLIRMNAATPRWVFVTNGLDSVRTWRVRGADSSTKAIAQDSLGFATRVIDTRGTLVDELSSWSPSAQFELDPASIVAVPDGTADDIVATLVPMGRADVDIDTLRARWDYFAKVRSYVGDPEAPKESLMRRALRRAEHIAPRPVGLAKGLIRKILR